MSAASIGPPRTRIERVRRGLAVCGAALCVLSLPQSIGSTVDGRHIMISLAANVAVVALLVFVHYHRGRFATALIPVSAVLAMLTGIGLNDPIAVLGICIGLIIGQTMYGSRRSIIFRVACLLPVVPVSVAFSASPLSDHIVFNVQAALSSLPAIPVFASLILLLRTGLESQAKTIARETFMAKLSSGLLAADTIHDIAPVMARANPDLVHLSPGLITLELRRIGPGEAGPKAGARLLELHGTGPGDQIPTIIPPEALRNCPAFGVERAQSLRAGSPVLTELGLPHRKWHAIALERDPEVPSDLILHGVRAGLGLKLFGVLSPEEQEFEIIVDLMSRHWRAAMIRVEQRAALLEAEEQDDVTGLPDRSATMRRIVELVHGTDRPVGLILLGLDGLDRIEADGGLAAADVAMNQVAYRIVEEVDHRGFVGRAGDSSFAVLVPQPESSHQLEELVGRLEQALLEPVLVPRGVAGLSVRVGTVLTTDGSTAADLLDRASRTMTEAPLSRSL